MTQGEIDLSCQLAKARAERDRAVALLVEIEANARRAWRDRSLSASAWPADLAVKLSEAVTDMAGIDVKAARLDFNAARVVAGLDTTQEAR